jgi:hypothetical protein
MGTRDMQLTPYTVETSALTICLYKRSDTVVMKRAKTGAQFKLATATRSHDRSLSCPARPTLDLWCTKSLGHVSSHFRLILGPTLPLESTH